MVLVQQVSKSLMKFSKSQINRYSRQIILKKIGAAGQKKILNSKVLIIGAGGLGAPAAMYLTASGIGKNFDIFIDCSDNFRTRFLINDYCLKKKKNSCLWCNK